MATEDNYYAILELNPDATEAEVRKSYRRMALRWHPDKNQANPEQAERRFKLVSEAYEVLSDPEKRRIYNFYGKQGLAEAAAAGSDEDFLHRQEQQQRQQQQQSQQQQRQRGRDWHHEHQYHFRDPRDVFRDFFGPSDPYTRILNPDRLKAFEESMRNLGDRHRASNNIGGANFANFGAGGLFDFANFGASSASANTAGSRLQASGASSSRSRLAPLHGTRVSKTFTKTVDGRRVVVHKVAENGVETVTETVDGRVTRKTVNGRPVTAGDEQERIRVT